MLPFTIELKHGEAVYEQLLAAIRKALFNNQLRHGDPFPSVRQLSQELRISPTTAHKVVGLLKADGLLAPKPGIGMVVTVHQLPDRNGRRDMIADSVRKLVRETKDLSLELDDLRDSVEEEWHREDTP